MRIARSLAELRTLLPFPPRTRPLALVPTMGALHEGHGALVDRARQDCGFVAVSIFVNPLQFGPDEDLDRYPRTEEQDLALLRDRGVDLVFLPSPRELVPRTAGISVAAGPLGGLYCGRSRPGHFDGVLTIVLKLLHLFAPDIAVFGEKDRQQLCLIRSMVRDLSLPVEIVGVGTVREPDGLATSSRNRYLTPPEREIAGRFPDLLDKAATRWSAIGTENQATGSPDLKALEEELSSALSRAGFQVDYVALAHKETLLPLPEPPVSREAILLAAVFLGTTRLIDNRELPAAAEPPGPKPPGKTGV